MPQEGQRVVDKGSDAPGTTSDRVLDRFGERRAELAAAALKTLAELGYCRTSMREIAQNSSFSHGVLHYYFDDKVELIGFCVRQFSEECVGRYDQIVAESTTAEELREAYIETLSRLLVDDAPMNRLWYDLRTQSMFDPGFQDDVRQIEESFEQTTWRLVARYAELVGRAPVVDSAVAYATLDGLFQHALVKHFNGDTGAAAALGEAGARTLRLLVPDV